MDIIATQKKNQEENYFIVPKHMWGLICKGAKIRLVKKGEQIPGGFLHEIDNAKNLIKYRSTYTINPSTKYFTVLISDITTIWKKYATNGIIEFRLLEIAISRLEKRVIQLEANLEKLKS